ncbi:hypothetical protein HNR42_000401 [Deinobacterium chartae]|uniref:HAD family phosphatase n=1 Tax=Deinobacterium chartae TaxID=521158 RepID=A0A841HXM5_9DEIO|nr:HAD family hydrolase [Deinobacterium chartae]MBB6096989.1 hypothetical protein [Deinobacterium chartae]
MLLAFDLDGTIVTRDHRLPEEIREAIFAARDRGHAVTVITGRNYASARQYLEALEVDCHYGTCQGARVHAYGEDHHLELSLTPEELTGLLEHFERHPELDFFLSTRNGLFVREPGDTRWDWARKEGQQVHALVEYGGEIAHKIVCSTPRVSYLHSELSERFPHLAYYPWDDRYLEVVAAGGFKGSALERIAAIHGVAQGETVAFGDGENDVSMLRWAGRAVGVGYMAPGVAALVREHAAAPEELGVARWLEENLLS